MWDTESPEFPVCFCQTILIWAPCAFLWTFAILDVFYMRSSLCRNIPWNWFNGLKFLLNIALIVLSAVDLGSALARKSYISIYEVEIYTPIIKIATFVSILTKYGTRN